MKNPYIWMAIFMMAYTVFAMNYPDKGCCWDWPWPQGKYSEPSIIESSSR